MAKAYWIARIDVDDAETYKSYVATGKPAFERHGAKFLVLENRSQYPRADFYDSGYHLRQSAQQRHSALLAQGLKPLLPRSP